MAVCEGFKIAADAPQHVTRASAGVRARSPLVQHVADGIEALLLVHVEPGVAVLPGAADCGGILRPGKTERGLLGIADPLAVIGLLRGLSGAAAFS